jgi:hypothetical protein
MSFVVLHVSRFTPVHVPPLLLFVLALPATLYLSAANPLAAQLFRERPLHTALMRKTGRAGALFIDWKSTSAKVANGRRSSAATYVLQPSKGYLGWPLPRAPMSSAMIVNVGAAARRSQSAETVGQQAYLTQPGILSMTHTWCGLLCLVSAVTMGSALAHSQQRPTLHTNESYIEEATRATTLAIDDEMEVFAFVLDSLPDRVKIYPTENYYYFTFIHNGTRYAGNIRIEPNDSGGQTVHFAYYEDASEWHEDAQINHTVLDASRGWKSRNWSGWSTGSPTAERASYSHSTTYPP